MIKRLAPDIAVRIAAGEVIERPASVAKELMENSIDAGAKFISIQTEAGGKSSFVIEDDGCGIAFEELPLALERYATSKITSLEDLEKIATLGYRGEALSSVAAVSRLEIISRAASSEEGGLIRCEGGSITLHSHTNAKPGTRIQIDDLFFNLPARRKFLKTSSAELRRIIQIINDYALIHYDTTYRLTENGKKILSYEPVATIGEALARRWGLQTKIYSAENISGSYGVKLWWNPIPDSRRVVLTLFVNGRRIQDAAVRAALSAADAASYGEWMVSVELPPEEVDVNIHPTKEEVRFRKSGELFKAVYETARTVFAARHSINTASGFNAPTQSFPDPFPAQGVSGYNSQRGWTLTEKKQPPLIPSRTASPAAPVFIPGEEEEPHQSTLISAEEAASFTKKYIGQNSQGFLIFDFPEALAIMDPHAAHERILFEEICRGFSEKMTVQQLTLPAEIPQAAAQEAALYEKELASLGFIIKNGAITGVPAIKGKGHLPPAEMLRSALRGIETENDPVKRDREVWWRMARLACRDAVKLGYRFEPEEAEELLRRLEGCETPYTCPHGRPTVFLIENNRLREWFER